MYLIAAFTVILYLAGGILSAGEEIQIEGEKLLKPFYKIAQFLYKKACRCKWRLFSSIQVKKDLERLHPGENVEFLTAGYYVKKVGLLLAVFLLGTVVSTAVKLQAGMNRQLDGRIVPRGDYRQGDKNLLLEAQVGSSYRQKLDIKVSQRVLPAAEAAELENSFWEELSRRAMGENSSLANVNRDLKLSEALDNYPFQAEWSSSRPELLSYTGEVAEIKGDSGEDVLLHARITYRDMEWEHELTVHIIPPELSEKEKLGRELQELTYGAEESDPTSDTWELPAEVEGQKIIWREKAEDNSLVFWLVTAAAAAAVYFMTDQDLHNGMKKRKEEMQADYAGIVNKIALYLGAGMTVKGAFKKIAEKYRTETGCGKRPAYDEMLYTCRELETGVAEGAAYERFGRRTGLQEYIRLSTLLTQNLKKGNRTLLTRLNEEARRALQEQMNHRKKAGDEASTKLLAPMVMMLGIVMVLIIIPAFSSFGI